MRKFIIYLVIFSSLLAKAYEEGDECTGKEKLPKNLVCSDASIVDCNQATNTYVMKICSGEKAQSTDKELNSVYRQVIHNLKKDNDQSSDYAKALNALIEAQRAWIKMRDEDCTVVESMNLQGTGQAIEVSECYAVHTQSRTKYLRELLKYTK